MSLKKNLSILKKLLTGHTGFQTPEAPKFIKKTIWGTGALNHNKIPAIIWIYWHDTSFPRSVSIAIASIKKYFPHYTVHVLNKENVHSYCPEFELLPDRIQLQHKTDYLRLYLLKHYGGIWIDATMYFTQSISAIFNLEDGCDFYGFYSEELTNDTDFPIIENYFMAAPKNAPFITDWLKEFESCLADQDYKKYYFPLLKDKTFCQNLYNWEYLVCYASAMKVMRESMNYRLCLAKAGDCVHLFYYDHLEHGHPIADLLLLNKAPHAIPPAVKLVGTHRKEIDDYLKMGFFHTDSLFFQLMTMDKTKKEWKNFRIKAWFALLKEVFSLKK